MTNGFAQTNTVYECLIRFRIEKSLISHDLFKEYDLHVKELRHRLKEVELVDDYARLLLSNLRSFSYIFSGLPLPFGHASVSPPNADSLPKQLLHLVSFPSQQDRDIAVNAIKILHDLTRLGSNPILDKIIEHADNNEIALLISKTRYLPEVREFLSVLYPNVRILTPNSLRKTQPIERLILLGSPTWYPDRIFTAPRCSFLQVICYDWLYAPKIPSPLLELSSKPAIHASWSEQSWTGKWHEAITRFADENVDDERHDNVSARLFLLECDYAVLLENADTARIYVVDPDGSEIKDEGATVERVKVQDLEPGMFALLRVGGGGDYIVEVADELMGAEGKQRRDMQNHWKQLLKTRILHDGHESVVAALESSGCSKANSTNVRNWASSRNIKTNSLDDFEAIMTVVGLADMSKEYWLNAKQIHSAHLRAGDEIKWRLLKRVTEANVSMLDDQGYMEFELPIQGQDAGKLAAFRILSISPESYEVSYSKTGQPFRLEDDEWRE